MKKAKVLETLESFPDEFSAEKLIEKLIFIEKVEEGIKQATRAKPYPWTRPEKGSMQNGRNKVN